MTVRGKIECLECEVKRLKFDYLQLRGKYDHLYRTYDSLFDRLSRLEAEKGASGSCGCHAQPKNTSSPKKDLKVRIPYDIICD